jgi:hypothetical protein
VYNHLPKVDPTRSLDGRRHSPHDERAELRRLHREHMAAERAKAKAWSDVPPSAPFPERLVSGPAAAILALLGARR